MLAGDPQFRPWIETTRGPVLLSEVGAEEAFAWWQSQRAKVDETGQWPIILGSDFDAEAREDLIESNPVAVEETLAAAEGIAVSALFARMLEETAVDEEEEDEEFEGFGLDFNPADLQPSPEKPFVLDSVGDKPKSYKVALVPVRAGHEVPAACPFGSWNSCPSDAEHIAILRDWNTRYGAELVVMTHDVIQLLVPRPPIGPEEIKRVALEQYAYCPDIVEQGTESVQVLAQEISNSKGWFFWWD